MVIGQTGERVDVVVIGGGPGGYSAAIRAAQLGRQVVLVERGAIGGICLNHGCIPSKALLSAARLAAAARRGAVMGIEANVAVDLARLQVWKREVVARLSGGVRSLLDRWGVRVVMGTAHFAGERRISVDTGQEEYPTFYEFHSAILAMGSRGAVGENGAALTPEQALDLEELPQRLVVLGGDYIAVELATAFARLGSGVTLLHDGRQVLGELDEPLLSRAVLGGLRRLDAQVQLGVTVERVTRDAVAYNADGTPSTTAAEVIVDARRRVPNTTNLGLEFSGVRRSEDGTIRVDGQQRTNVHHVFAVGDITPGPPLAHRAILEGRVAAEVAAGLPAAMEPLALPLAYFTEPEVAAVGTSERAARAAGIDVVTARFPLAASGRALTLAETEGFIQLVAEAGTGRVLGIQLAGPGATELAGEAALAIEMTATLDDLALTLHPHPTLGEGFVEAADLALGRPRHLFRGSRQ